VLVAVNEQIGMVVHHLGEMGDGVGEEHHLHEILEREVGMKLPSPPSVQPGDPVTAPRFRQGVGLQAARHRLLL
jgi:hypothetical protein